MYNKHIYLLYNKLIEEDERGFHHQNTPKKQRERSLQEAKKQKPSQYNPSNEVFKKQKENRNASCTYMYIPQYLSCILNCTSVIILSCTHRNVFSAVFFFIFFLNCDKEHLVRIPRDTCLGICTCT